MAFYNVLISREAGEGQKLPTEFSENLQVIFSIYHQRSTVTSIYVDSEANFPNQFLS